MNKENTGSNEFKEFAERFDGLGPKNTGGRPTALSVKDAISAIASDITSMDDDDAVSLAEMLDLEMNAVRDNPENCRVLGHYADMIDGIVSFIYEEKFIAAAEDDLEYEESGYTHDDEKENSLALAVVRGDLTLECIADPAEREAVSEIVERFELEERELEVAGYTGLFR